jgi:sulfopyruvate decarboxylase subunit alpha
MNPPHDDTLGLASVLTDRGFDLVLTVPCSILREWYYEPAGPQTIYLSREEEGVGIAAGTLAAGRRPLLMIQNSGMGNCVNALASLAVAYEIPLVIAVSLRGDDVDENPAQFPMGAATEGVITALGCEYTVASSVADLAQTFDDGLQRAQQRRRPHFILLPRRSATC